MNYYVILITSLYNIIILIYNIAKENPPKYKIICSQAELIFLKYKDNSTQLVILNFCFIYDKLEHSK